VAPEPDLQVVVSRKKRTVALVAAADPNAGVADEGNRAEILAAAAEAFMTNGYAATSIDTVADLLGATKGRIYYQYKSKADLFFDVHREAMRMNLEAISTAAGGNAKPAKRLRRMILEHAMLVMTKLPFQRVSVQGVEMHLESSTTPSQREVLRSLIDMRDKYEKLFVDVLQEGMAAKEFNTADPHFLVKPLLGALNWMTVWYRPDRDHTDADRRMLAEQMADFLLDGIAARP